MAEVAPDPSASFTQLLGHLIYLLREVPGEEAAVLRTVEMMAARVAKAEFMVEAGIENSWALDGDPLKERLQVRQVDAIGIAAGATAMELLEMGRALADDTAPIASTAQIRVKLLPDPLPIQFSGPRPMIPLSHDDALPRARQGDQLAGMIEGILRELGKAIDRQQWLAVLHDAQAASRAIPNLTESARRTYTIALKRMMSLPVIEALIEQGYRMAEERSRTAEVLRTGGAPAAERMMEILKKSDTIGPRAFLVEAMSGMADAAPLFPSMLRSPRANEVRLAAELMGRSKDEAVIPLLVAQAQHPDESVRMAVIDALASFNTRSVMEPLRKALAHSSGATRARAARALGSRSTGAIAMPLFAAFESEKDPETWRELLNVIAALNSHDAAMGLARMALERRGFLRFVSSDMRRRLAVVQALAASGSATSHHALEYIAKEGDGEVQAAAVAALAK